MMLLTLLLTEGAVLTVEHAHVAAFMTARVDQAPLPALVEGHLAGGTQVLRLHPAKLLNHIDI